MNWQIQHNHQKHQLGTRLFPQKVFQASSDDGQEKSHTTIILKSKGSLDDLVLIQTGFELFRLFAAQTSSSFSENLLQGESLHKKAMKKQNLLRNPLSNLKIVFRIPNLGPLL